MVSYQDWVRATRTPTDTFAIDLDPQSVRLGDHILLEGVYYPIRDMRDVGCGAKLLILDGRPPWRMAGPLRMYRPKERTTAGGFTSSVHNPTRRGMTVTTSIEATSVEETATRLLWLDLTRKCQLNCTHCYNASGPDGTHGTMVREDWVSVLDQAAAYGVRNIQFIGGEPTMHPNFTDLVDHALTIGLNVEVYSNLVHVSKECWDVFQRNGLSLATSYYSDRAEEHEAMTGRRSHERTRTNIERAVGLGIPLRVGIINSAEGQPVTETQRDLEALGVRRISVDGVRPFGRGAQGQAPDMANLCGRCGAGRAAISPTGEVSPCVFSGWMSVGNVMSTPLATILSGGALKRANTAIRAEAGGDDDDDNDDECSPGFPGSECTPRN
ncbi:radical SAM/SPASM domain-containing protein [Streptomyces scopuliridis]|uniref:radical SAM/SPASM domain-containing protein n=1 Tax=Streptomyces scopuliridis TaxID=452529 RepID=UPI0036AFB253